MSVLAAILSASIALQPSAASSTPPQPPADEEVTVLDEIVVDGRPLEDYVRDFVSEIGATARDRGLARWRDRVCVGVANMDPEAAQYVADRVSEVALDLGLRPGEPGCRPDLIIVAADDGAAMADALVRRQEHNFRVGHLSTDLGAAALRDFRSMEKPVRWWATSMPVNSENGMRAVRLPGDVDPEGRPVAPAINQVGGSRLISRIRDDLIRSVVIIDMPKAEGASLRQLADYTAMVSLAQIDPKADASGYNSILNLFSAGRDPEGLTEWDMSYLRALYSPNAAEVTTGRQTSAVLTQIERDDASRAE